MNKNTESLVNSFCVRLKEHAFRKAKLYDGVDNVMSADEALRYAAEELGEVAAEITRHRWFACQAETIDLAHCAMLVYIAIERIWNEEATTREV